MRWLVVLLLSSCASQPLSEDDVLAREYKYQQLREDYALCREIHRGLWVSTFRHSPHYEPRYMELRWDYVSNGCPMIISRACKRGTIEERC